MESSIVILRFHHIFSRLFEGRIDSDQGANDSYNADMSKGLPYPKPDEGCRNCHQSNSYYRPAIRTHGREPHGAERRRDCHPKENSVAGKHLKARSISIAAGLGLAQQEPGGRRFDIPSELLVHLLEDPVSL